MLSAVRGCQRHANSLATASNGRKPNRTPHAVQSSFQLRYHDPYRAYTAPALILGKGHWACTPT